MPVKKSLLLTSRKLGAIKKLKKERIKSDKPSKQVKVSKSERRMSQASRIKTSSKSYIEAIEQKKKSRIKDKKSKSGETDTIMEDESVDGTSEDDSVVVQPSASADSSVLTLNSTPSQLTSEPSKTPTDTDMAGEMLDATESVMPTVKLPVESTPEPNNVPPTTTSIATDTKTPSPTNEPSLNPVFGSDKSCQLLSDGSFGKATNDRRGVDFFYQVETTPSVSFQTVNNALLPIIEEAIGMRVLAIFFDECHQEATIQRGATDCEAQGYSSSPMDRVLLGGKSKLVRRKCSHVHNYILCLFSIALLIKFLVSVLEKMLPTTVLLSMPVLLFISIPNRPVLMLLRGQRWK